MRRAFLVFIIGLGIGALGGAIYGWVYPLHEVSASIDKLHPDYKADYAVMVGAAYAEDGDWDRAQERLGKLAEPDPAKYLVDLAERYIDEARDPDHIRSLVRMVDHFGYMTPKMQPYLPVSEGQP